MPSYIPLHPVVQGCGALTYGTTAADWCGASSGGGVPAPGAGDDDDSDDDDSTVRSRVDGSPSLKRNELQTYESTNSSVAGPLAGGLTIPSAATKSNDDPGNFPHTWCLVLSKPCAYASTQVVNYVVCVMHVAGWSPTSRVCNSSGCTQQPVLRNAN